VEVEDHRGMMANKHITVGETHEKVKTFKYLQIKILFMGK
jgi:hypothetical protein